MFIARKRATMEGTPTHECRRTITLRAQHKISTEFVFASGIVVV